MRWLLIGLVACGNSGTSGPIDAFLGDATDFDVGGPAFLFLGSSSLQDFGSTPIGLSIERDVIVTNGGGDQSGVPSATITGADAASWSLSIGCANLFPGESCDYPLMFVPTTTGNKVAELSVTAMPGGTVNVALEGIGVTTDLSVSQPSVAFAATTVGLTSTPTVITARNLSTVTSDPASISLAGANPGQFTPLADNCTGIALAPSGTCTVSIAFSPSSPTSSTASLTITAAPVGAATVALSGTGTP